MTIKWKAGQAFMDHAFSTAALTVKDHFIDQINGWNTYKHFSLATCLIKDADKF